MSHNLLSGSVEFIGPALGEIEDIVNTHGTQTITGPKTFTNITASGGNTVGLSVDGDIDIDGALAHAGDSDTRIEFTLDNISFYAGHNDISSGSPRIFRIYEQLGKGYLDINPAQKNISFIARSEDNDLIMKLDANHRAITIGSNQDVANSDVMVSLSSSYHTGSLFSVGNLKNPILAVSGGNGSHANWKVKVSGTLTTDGNITPAGNVIAGGYVTGSLGIRGELLNTGNGLENSELGGELKLSVKPVATNSGLSVGTDGVKVDFSTLTDVALETATDGTADYVFIQDYNGGNTRNAKIKLGTILGNTAKPTMTNTGTGAEVFKSVAPGDGRTQQLRKIKATTTQLVQVTQNTDDIEISTVANPQVTALTSSNTVLSGSTRNEYAIRNITAHGANISITHPSPRYQIFNAGENAYNATASLPQITNDNVGMIYNIKFLSAASCLITGSAGHEDLIDGVSQVTMSGGAPGNAKFKELLAVEPVAGSYEWVVIGEN